MTRTSERIKGGKRIEASTTGFLVLGVDPGTLVTGYGLVCRKENRLLLVACGAIKSGSDIPLPVRLKKIYGELKSIIEEFRPDEVAIESTFYGRNAQSALKLGHARGVAILAAAKYNIPISEYSPREVKQSVTGRGQASKSQVQYMVRTLLSSPNNSMRSDTSDALATAICHHHRLLSPERKQQADWKSFILAHSHRVRS